MDWTTGDSGSIPDKSTKFWTSQIPNRLSEAHPTSYPMGKGSFFPWGETGLSPPSSVLVKNTWSCTSTLPYAFMVWWLIKHRYYHGSRQERQARHSPHFGFFRKCKNIPIINVKYLCFFFCKICCHVWVCDYRRGLDWWMHLLSTYTNNSELQALTAPPLISARYKSLYTKPFPACCVSTSRSPATVSNSGDSSASCPQVPSSQPPAQNTTELIAPTVLVITYRNGPHRKHRSSIVAFLSAAAVTCLPSCCSETAAARTKQTPFFYCCGRYLVTATVYRVTA
jgi:hypothetical protein